MPLQTPLEPAWWFIYRSAVTGRFVSLDYAQHHPGTTVREVMTRTMRRAP